MNTHYNRWMFEHCPKKHAWIIYQNIENILQDTEVVLAKKNLTKVVEPSEVSRESIVYVHSVFAQPDLIRALIELESGYYIISNKTLKKREEVQESKNDKLVFEIDQDKKEVEEIKINSKFIYFGKKIKDVLKFTNTKMQKSLGLEKIKKTTYTDEYLRPYKIKNVHDYFDLKSKDGHLDLSYNFEISSEDLNSWEPKNKIVQLTLNTCFQLDNFSWIKKDWAKNLTHLNLINIPQLTNLNVEFIGVECNNLEQLQIFYCSQINIRLILGLAKHPNLKTLSLYDPNLVTQPNKYSGLIQDKEWEFLRNYKLEKLLINSDNLSLDVIDYLIKTFSKLSTLIINPTKCKELHKNIMPGFSQDMITIAASNKEGSFKMPRDSMIKNLFKDTFQDPYSESMKNIMKNVYGQDIDEHITSHVKNK